LTEDENNDLAELKQKMGLLLAALQEARLLSPVLMKSSKREIRRASSSAERSNPDEEVVVVEEDTVEDSIYRKRPIRRDVVVADRSPREDGERERVVIEDSPRRDRTRSSTPSSSKEVGTGVL